MFAGALEYDREEYFACACNWYEYGLCIKGKVAQYMKSQRRTSLRLFQRLKKKSNTALHATIAFASTRPARGKHTATWEFVAFLSVAHGSQLCIHRHELLCELYAHYLIGLLARAHAQIF